MSVFVIRPIGLLPVCILLLVLLIADNSGLNYIAQGQLLLFPKTSNSGSSATNLLPYINQQQQPIKQTQPNPHLVKITLPVKGQQVPTGKDLMIFGTSTSNATSDCKVSIKANGDGPYRDASPGGNSSSGRVDYTKWNFTLTPAYTLIKAGQNKITAKFACGSNPLLTSHYSVNVTGVNTAPNTTSSNYQELAQTQHLLASTSKARVGSLNGSAIDTTTPIASSNPFKSSAASTNDHKILPISLSVDLSKSTAHQGDTQTVTVAVTDKNSSKPIAGASVLGNISSSSGLYKKVKGMTDSKGQASYSWTVSSTDLTGKYKVMMQGYAPNYQSKSAVKTFKVTSVPAVTTPSDSIDSSPTQFNPQPASNINDNLLIPPALTFPSSTTAAPPSTSPSITPHTKTKSHHHPSSTINPNPAASNSNNNNNNNLITPPPQPPPSTSPSITPPTKTKSHHHLTPTTNPNTSASNSGNDNNNLITPPPQPPPSSAPSITPHTKTKSHHHPTPTINPGPTFGVPITTVPFTIP